MSQHFSGQVSPVNELNLRAEFGIEYQIEFEESYYAAYGPNPSVDDPVYQIIPCKNGGHYFPWGRGRMAASTDRSGSIATRLAALPHTTVEQDGNDGVTVSFDVECFPQVAKILKPRRRRRLNNKTRQAFVEAGRRHQFGQKTVSLAESKQ